MALIKLKPTSPGTRFQLRVSRKHLHKGGPYEPLTVAHSNTGARNHFGRITTRHVGGGSRQKYRLIDFRRDKDGITAVVERIEYDPNRTAHIALLLYA
ncbi:MAG: 50S ribosomal protein L2, partial [Steroidobacteraceae bacterium]